MSDERGRWLLVTFTLPWAIILQAISMWRDQNLDGLDWLLLGIIALATYAHFDAPVPD